MVERKSYSKDFKIEAVRLMKLSEKSVSQLAVELGVRRNQLYKWEEQLERKGPEAFGRRGRKPKAGTNEVTRLRRELPKSRRSEIS